MICLNSVHGKFKISMDLIIAALQQVLIIKTEQQFQVLIIKEMAIELKTTSYRLYVIIVKLEIQAKNDECECVIYA